MSEPKGRFFLFVNSCNNVLESAVIGVDNGKYGQVPIAFVELINKDTITQRDILMHCHKNLSSYKCPKEIIFINKMPKNIMNKIDKKQLIEFYKLNIF
jgi:acyl-coenzyme A synthetase/AMP-(fatty) acid ligase